LLALAQSHSARTAAAAAGSLHSAKVGRVVPKRSRATARRTRTTALIVDSFARVFALAAAKSDDRPPRSRGAEPAAIPASD